MKIYVSNFENLIWAFYVFLMENLSSLPIYAYTWLCHTSPQQHGQTFFGACICKVTSNISPKLAEVVSEVSEPFDNICKSNPDISFTSKPVVHFKTLANHLLKEKED